MSKKVLNILFLHLLTPVLISIFIGSMYYFSHVSSGAISIPPGIEHADNDFMPLKIEPMIHFWKEESKDVGFRTFYIAIFCSIAYFFFETKIYF
jgi:hypothetical protein